MIDSATWLFLLLQVFFVDLLLGTDNAIVIALACRRLPPEDRRLAVLFGAIGAIVLRLGMVLFANAMLGVPLLKLVAAWTLVVIGLNVKAQKHNGAEALKGAGPASDFLSAAAVIVVADAAMSLDNVVALAAIAGGNLWLLAIGVAMSIPILAYGALLLTEITEHAPELLAIGAAFLGWIAGGMAVSDPLIAGWIEVNAPALPAFAPGLVALFVLAAGQDVKQSKAGLAKPARAGSGPWRSPAPSPEPMAAPTPSFTPRDSVLAPSPKAVPPPGVPREDAFGASMPSKSGKTAAGGWTEERVVIAGFVLLAFLAGLIIFVASLFDSLT